MRAGSATFVIVLLLCFMRSQPGSSAVHAAEGLERAYSVRERPDHPQAGPLRLEARVSGGRGALHPATVDAWTQQQELTAADGERGDVFGYSVDVSEQTAIIGAPGRNIGSNVGQGAAYVFTCVGVPCTWRQQQELKAADGARDDEFGNAVAVSGNTAIIGAWGRNSTYSPGAPTTALAPRGAAYVFRCAGAPCRWKQQQVLTATDGASGDEFANTIAMSGNTVIIGAPYKNSYRGAAYIFACSGTPCIWKQQQELTATDGARGDVFGYSVALSGRTVVIGAIGHSPRGAAYVFTCTGTPCTWRQRQELAASDGVSGDVFGTRVAVSGAIAVIGAPGKKIYNHSLQGAAYVFRCIGNPCIWKQQQELTASLGASRDQFGTRVAMSGDTAIIGNNSSQGAAYVFTCSGTPCTWKGRPWLGFRVRREQELTAADGTHGDEFAYSVAIAGNTAIIGAAYKHAYQGAAYVFGSRASAITEPPASPP